MKFHLNIILRVKLTMWQHCFRQWLGIQQVTSHYLKLCWYVVLTHIYICVTRPRWVNTYLGRDKMTTTLQTTFSKFIFVNEKSILIHISPKCIPNDPIINKAALVLLMAWRRTGVKWWPSLPIFICVTQCQWVLRRLGSHSLLRCFQAKWPGRHKRHTIKHKNSTIKWIRSDMAVVHIEKMHDITIYLTGVLLSIHRINQ